MYVAFGVLLTTYYLLPTTYYLPPTPSGGRQAPGGGPDGGGKRVLLVNTLVAFSHSFELFLKVIIGGYCSTGTGNRG